ncbi:MAG TPA: class I adenylate-forming enzyme family protein [Rubrivivax sp.]|nr:class I adenylate-forming enzyme family protein [Rubrivivax sp.]
MSSLPENALPFCALPALIRRQAQSRPAAPALHEDDRSIDYGQLDALMDRVAASLQRDGLRPREHIAICAAASIDYLVVFLGALRAGLAVAPLAPGSTPEQLAAMAHDAGAKLVFVDAAAANAGVAWSSPAVLLQDDSAQRGSLQHWLAPVGAEPAAVHIDPDWAFNLIYSSGTTGTPKGIVQPHAMRWAHIQRAGQSGYGPETVTLIATPLYSNTTLVCVIPTLAYGGCVVLLPKFDAQRYLQLAQQHRATHTMLVPVQYQRLMSCPDFDRYDLSAFQFKFCTSAPFHAELKAQVLARWPGALIEYYGMTEGGGTCILSAHQFPDKLHTVGQPAEGHDIRLIDPQGVEVPRIPGGSSQTSGEVVGRSAGMMTGYHGLPEKTAEAEWYDEEGRRYIRTGDIGRFDEDGFLILQDRCKDMIISGGFNVYPSDLEAVLRQHPDVIDAAVVGVPSAEWGETPVAFVVARPMRSDDGEALRQWANSKLGKTQRLAAVRLLGELPRSAIGKVLKRELRDLHVNAAYPESLTRSAG